jgi:molybdopterin converting factor small subunit
MHITVHIYASLRSFLRAAEISIWEKNWEVPEDCSVNRVLERLNLPKQVHVMVLVNNKSIDPKTSLKEGDIIHILPQMFGG